MIWNYIEEILNVIVSHVEYVISIVLMGLDLTELIVVYEFYLYWIQFTFIGLLAGWVMYSTYCFKAWEFWFRRFVGGCGVAGIFYITTMLIYFFFILDNNSFFEMLGSILILVAVGGAIFGGLYRIGKWLFSFMGKLLKS